MNIRPISRDPRRSASLGIALPRGSRFNQSLVAAATILAILLTIGAGISVAQTARPAHTSLAILDPEIIGDSPGRDTRALADGIDADLAENLARQPSLVIVDRQSIDSILAEQALQKMTQSSATAVAALRAAGALLCTRIDIKSRTVIIEAVSAQSGGLLASVYAQLPGTTDHDILTTVQTRTKNLAQQIADTAAAQQGKPTLEISARLTSAQSRIAWMADDLSETFGAKITAGNSVTLLTPRQPLYTKEERLLRVMGLAAAPAGDAIAGLRASPDIRLDAELIDSMATNVAFEKTPIRLKLSLRRGDAAPIATQFDATVAGWDACRGKAADWLTAQLRHLTGSAAPADDEKRAKALATQELAEIAPWAQTEPELADMLDPALRIRIE